MSRNVNDIINKLSPAQRKRVETRAAQLIAEEMTLQQLRQACKLTQQKVAKSLRIGQEGVSKLEKRSDLLISLCAISSRPWVDNYPWSSNFQTGRRLSCQALASLYKIPNPVAGRLTQRCEMEKRDMGQTTGFIPVPPENECNPEKLLLSCPPNDVFGTVESRKHLYVHHRILAGNDLAVEVAVRDAALLPQSLVGVDLMRKAFAENTGPLTDTSSCFE